MFKKADDNHGSRKTLSAFRLVSIPEDSTPCNRAWNCPVIRQDRQQIAMDMHDGVIQSLFALGMQIELLSNSENIQPDELRPLTTGLNQVIEDIRHYIRDSLNPEPQGKGLSLHQAIVAIVKELHPPLEVVLDINIPEKMPSFSSVVFENICLMVKEALSNALRHAHAQTIQIMAYPLEKSYRFLIVDDGQGFSLAALKRHEGMGLKNLQARASFYGGQVEIKSQPGFGTTVMLEMPFD